MRNAPSGIVFNEKDEVLLVLRRFPPLTWSPPGGFDEPGENYTETVEREVFEETGITCVSLAPLGDYIFKETDARLIIFVCLYLFGSLRCSYESKDIRWVSLDKLPDNISPDKEVFHRAFELYQLTKQI